MTGIEEEKNMIKFSDLGMSTNGTIKFLDI